MKVRLIEDSFIANGSRTDATMRVAIAVDDEVFGVTEVVPVLPVHRGFNARIRQSTHDSMLKKLERAIGQRVISEAFNV